MKYNTNLHYRLSTRLKGYDFSQAGAYFITICCHSMMCRFGEIAGNAVAGLASSISNNNHENTPFL